ncbi:hypothetical protein ONQ60_23965, partial [Salmonella enterica subsp. enterica serovar Virginia]|nr:hypothetical protein [Salmonella enterica subsp. enterica serovar Virginia]
ANAPVRHNRIASTQAKMGRSIKKFAIKGEPRVSTYRYRFELLHCSGKLRAKRGEIKEIM